MATTLAKVLEESPSVDRRRPLLQKAEAVADMGAITTKEEKKKKPRKRAVKRGRIGEVAGDTAAVCCCCPCAVMHLVVLAVYKVPTGLCRKAWRKKKKKRLLSRKKKLEENQWTFPKANKQKGGLAGMLSTDESESEDDHDEEDDDGGNGPADGHDFDKEMWGRFHKSGFWRSPSEKEN